MSIRRDKPKFATFDARNIVPYLMLLFGSASLAGSAYFTSYILAFSGLGLTFWGALFLYIKFTKYVKIDLMNAVCSSNLDNIERALAVVGTDLKAIHLPPKNLSDPTSSLVFIPTKPNQRLPSSTETNPKELYSTDPAGLLMTPSGLDLSKLFEEELKRSFTETKLSELETQLPKLFEELQITRNLSLISQANGITVEIRNHIFKDLSEKTGKLEKTCMLLGSPIASALACVFAKATGQPIVIEKEETTSQGNTTIQYSILEK